MKQIFLRKLKGSELQFLYKGLKSSSAFTHRRCQILISCALGKSVKEISRTLFCSDQCVRDAIKDFNINGQKCITEKPNSRNNYSKSYNRTLTKSIEKIIAHPPSYYGIKSESWTLGLLGRVCYRNKIFKKQVSSRSVGFMLKKLGMNWKRIKKQKA